MKTRYTPHFVELTHAAALSSFWRKATLRRFLQSCDVPSELISTWAEEESKRFFLNRVFDELAKTERGKFITVKMAAALAEQTTFPDFKGLEECNRMTSEAKFAVRELKEYLALQEEALESDEQSIKARKMFFEHQQQAVLAKSTLKQLQERLDKLSLRLGTQEAGYEFQEWFFDLVDFFELQNRRPYSSKGRQIDGSITIAGTTYLAELKFTASQSGAPDIDVFRTKVETKADNTMGVFVSISGFSRTAIDAGSGPKTPVLLFEHSHLYLVLSELLSLPELIERTRRHASQTGDAYISVAQIMK